MRMAVCSNNPQTTRPSNGFWTIITKKIKFCSWVTLLQNILTGVELCKNFEYVCNMCETSQLIKKLTVSYYFECIRVDCIILWSLKMIFQSQILHEWVSFYNIEGIILSIF